MKNITTKTTYLRNTTLQVGDRILFEENNNNTNMDKYIGFEIKNGKKKIHTENGDTYDECIIGNIEDLVIQLIAENKGGIFGQIRRQQINGENFLIENHKKIDKMIVEYFDYFVDNVAIGRIEGMMDAFYMPYTKKTEMLNLNNTEKYKIAKYIIENI